MIGTYVPGSTAALCAAPLPGHPLPPEVTLERAEAALWTLSRAILHSDSPRRCASYRFAQDRWLDAWAQLNR